MHGAEALTEGGSGATGCSVNRSTGEVNLGGTVRDSSGGAIPAAQLVIQCGDLHLQTQTGADGTYVLHVPSGSFMLEVSRAGFEPLSRELKIEADSKKAFEENFVLTIAHAVTTVSVTASEGHVTETSAAGTKSDALLLDTPQSISVITNEQLTQRGVQTLNEALRYTLGVAVDAYGVDPRYDSFLIRGFGDDQNGIFVDGLGYPGYLGQTDPYLNAIAFEELDSSTSAPR